MLEKSQNVPLPKNSRISLNIKQKNSISGIFKNDGSPHSALKKLVL